MYDLRECFHIGLCCKGNNILLYLKGYIILFIFIFILFIFFFSIYLTDMMEWIAKS